MSDSKINKRYNKDKCPVCISNTKGCSRTEDNLQLCRGVSIPKGDHHGEFVSLGKDKNDEFCLFRRRTDEPRHRDPKPSAEKPLIDWKAKHADAMKHFSDERRSALAQRLDLPETVLASLCPGFLWEGKVDNFAGYYVFPMTNCVGEVCGLHGRHYKTDEKKAIRGSKLGAFTSTGWDGETEGNDVLFLPEGASDTLALTAMGIPALGRPSAKAGVDALAALLSQEKRKIIVLGEFDPKQDGSWPGKDGAIATAKKLAAMLNREVHWAFPPNKSKDVRTWFHGRGLGVDSLIDECHLAGEAFLNGLKLQVINPSEGGEEDPELITCREDIPTLADAASSGTAKEWVWEGWIQKGVVNGLVGKFGHGKTRFVAEIFRRIAAGESWPDGQEMNLTKDSEFLFVPADYQHSELVDLAENYKFPQGCVFLNAAKDNAEGVDLFDSPKARARLEKRIEILRPALVVIDPITGTQSEKGSHSSAETATAVYGPLQRMASKYGTTFLILIHTNSQGETYGRHAQGKFRVETKLTEVEQPSGKPRYRLDVTKSNSAKPDALGATQKDNCWEFDDNPPETDEESTKRSKPGPKPKASEEAKKYLRDALDSGEQLQCEVVKAWEEEGKPTSTLFNTAKQMIDDGEIEEGERKSPRGKRMLKTWQLIPVFAEEEETDDMRF